MDIIDREMEKKFPLYLWEIETRHNPQQQLRSGLFPLYLWEIETQYEKTI